MVNVTCIHCGAPNRQGANNCVVCGHPLPAPAASPPALRGPHSPGSLQPTQVIPSAGAGGAELLLADGSVISLSASTTIGRDASQCNLSFPNDDRMSRVHASIEERGGQWIITNHSGSNGTLVNGAKISAPVALQPGYPIGIGSYIFTFSIPGIAHVPQPPTPYQPPTPPSPSWGPAPGPHAPPGGWRTWNRAPAAEGYVRSISDRFSMKKDDLLKRGLFAVGLALISPALSFLPFIHGSDIPARNMSLEDRLTGRRVDVLILGDMMGVINQGDAVAVWGNFEKGLLLMETTHNYASDSQIRLKR